MIGRWLLVLCALWMAEPAGARDVFEMTTSSPKSLPIIGTGSLSFVRKINEMSESVEFEHFDPNELIPPFEALDAVSDGAVDAAYTTAGYWQGKIPAAGFFSAVPFGPEPGEMLGWLLHDDGLALYQRMYDEHGYHVKVLPCGIVAPESSGWFRVEIESAEDLRGLNMRFFALGARVMQKLGVSTSLLAAADIYPALERGAIDAAEFSMPRVDASLGFHRIAPFNYFPGWHQPATLNELLVNRDRWDDLDAVTRRQIEVACLANVADSYAEGEATNFPAMVENVERHGVALKRWSPELIDLFHAAWLEVVDEIVQEDEFAAEVWADLSSYRSGYALWGQSAFLPRPRD